MNHCSLDCGWPFPNWALATDRLIMLWCSPTEFLYIYVYEYYITVQYVLTGVPGKLKYIIQMISDPPSASVHHSTCFKTPTLPVHSSSVIAESKAQADRSGGRACKKQRGEREREREREWYIYIYITAYEQQTHEHAILITNMHIYWYIYIYIYIYICAHARHAHDELEPLRFGLRSRIWSVRTHPLNRICFGK